MHKHAEYNQSGEIYCEKNDFISDCKNKNETKFSIFTYVYCNNNKKYLGTYVIGKADSQASGLPGFSALAEGLSIGHSGLALLPASAEPGAFLEWEIALRLYGFSGALVRYDQLIGKLGETDARQLLAAALRTCRKLRVPLFVTGRRIMRKRPDLQSSGGFRSRSGDRQPCAERREFAP